jgi:AGCS family alanine or glycine:cation symporter
MDFSAQIEPVLSPIVAVLSAVLFYPVAGFPFIVLWLVVAALFFTVYLRLVNVRLLGHAFAIATGKRPEAGGGGEISPLKALLSAIAATVGLGSIAGVSVAVAVGGPGAIFWIVLMGMFGMATKFAEVTLSMKYRKLDANGKVFGGPIQYLRDGLGARGYGTLGKVLAALFAVFILGGAIGGGNMFQSNSVAKIMSHELPNVPVWVIAAGFALLVLLVLFGSIKRIAKVAEAVTPMKGILYLICALIIMAFHVEQLPHALGLMLRGAFDASAVEGGMLGMLVVAFKRALFANEAGLGSAPIAHAAAQTREPVREGAVALIEPLFAAIIALLTGLMIVVTGAHEGASLNDGVLIAAKAFASVGEWFTILLAVNVFLFAYGTTLGWSYYGEIAWSYLFGRKLVKLYYLLFALACFMGGVLNFGIVVDFSDLLILGAALPNIVALYLLRGEIRDALTHYRKAYLT